MKTNDGGPAFPAPVDVKTDMSLRDVTSGMSLRDWFAGLAMQGLAARFGQVPVERARDAYAMADAMIAERERTGP